ncbi:hypothetical protein Tco_1401132 [Tanacetum coccineum]
MLTQDQWPIQVNGLSYIARRVRHDPVTLNKKNIGTKASRNFPSNKYREVENKKAGRLEQDSVHKPSRILTNRTWHLVRGPFKGTMALREIHEGVLQHAFGPRSVVAKVIPKGYTGRKCIGCKELDGNAMTVKYTVPVLRIRRHNLTPSSPWRHFINGG